MTSTPEELLAVIKAIETLVSDDDCAFWEYALATNRLKSKNEDLMAEKIGKIYTLSHAYAGTCGAGHDEWKLK